MTGTGEPPQYAAVFRYPDPMTQTLAVPVLFCSLTGHRITDVLEYRNDVLETESGAYEMRDVRVRFASGIVEWVAAWNIEVRPRVPVFWWEEGAALRVSEPEPQLCWGCRVGDGCYGDDETRCGEPS